MIMLAYFIRRLLYMLITLIAITVVGFIIIQLPPGDFLTSYINNLRSTGQEVSDTMIESLRIEYGLDLPVYLRYFRWVYNILQGRFGVSFDWNKPVVDLIGERLALTVTISIITLIFTYIVAIPIGIYSATRQYSIGDYTLTVLGFAGLATPRFLFALVLLFFAYRFFGVNAIGLFSQEYARAPWSFGKVLDMLKHLPVPVIVVGLAGTASLVRVMRATLLDELKKQYVITARSKGLQERTILFRYPVRVAINPIASTIGWMLPQIISGATIVAIVLNLPTVGPLLMRSLLSQDMYLAGALIIMISFLAVVGTLISDIVLMKIDPRIKFARRA